jgi:deferrochelatase/peroxidase EfeB
MFDLADVQGNILRGYTEKPHVRYLILEFADPIAARRWLAASISGRYHGVPQITTGDWGTAKPETCFNIGLTYEGLRALGTPSSSLGMFPYEFIAGMTGSAAKLGDVGQSAPENWPAPFNEPKRIHLIATIYADKVEQLEQVQQRALDRNALTLLGTREGCTFPGERQRDFVHFGYRDNITQPRFEGVPDSQRHPDRQPKAPLGTVLLGHPTDLEGLMWRVPQPAELGRNGTFNAFRVLKQDVAGFEKYLDQAAFYLFVHPKGGELLPHGDEEKIGKGPSRHTALREIVAANLCGRWRDGTPLALSADAPDPNADLTDFDYVGVGDARCPHGAHIRRCNPRGGQIVQRIANNSRRLIRRGVPYGPPYDPAKPFERDEPERGLLGNFIGASLGAQFEAMSCDWLNLGLQDPRITGSNDPISGANDPRTSWFDLPLKSGDAIRLHGLPEFVSTRGGAYTFLPSISAIRYLGSLTT